VDGQKGSAYQARCLDFDCSFSSTLQKTNQKKTPVPRLTLRVAKPGDEAAPYAAMLCCKACSGTHNLAIAALLASHYALPGSIILAASSGFSGRSMRKLASLKQSARFFRPRHRCSARGKGG
jgi:acetylornithine/succinyldiaminopimelate/putrescine aminotransferase